MEAIPIEPTFTFWDLKPGMKARILRSCSECGHGLRLQELGLTAGTVFEVTKVAPLNDPIEISVRGSRLCVRRREALDLEIEIVE